MPYTDSESCVRKDRSLLKIQVQYPDLSEEDLKELFPAKCQLVISKLSNRGQAYSLDDEPLFFDPEGRGDYLVPTIYALWRFPHILPTLYTHSQVSSKVSASLPPHIRMPVELCRIIISLHSIRIRYATNRLGSQQSKEGTMRIQYPEAKAQMMKSKLCCDPAL